MNKVGDIKYGNHIIPVYQSLDDPLFLAQDIMELIGYTPNNTFGFMRLLEHDEKMKLPIVVSGQNRYMWFITEMGLYNALAQSDKPLARAWRRIVHHELISLRKSKGLDIKEQFDDWDHALDNIYFDDEGRLWQSITVPGGDVEQICLSEEV